MKVLVVEDDRKIAAAVRRGLEAEGFAVDLAYDGIDGLWRASEHHYDVLIVDLLLPGKNGFQLCRELRERGNWTPMLILTAKNGDLDQSEALDTGADAYLTKPFSLPVLVSHARALLRRGSAARAGPLSVVDLTVDPARQRCWRAGRELSLTSREFAVLEYLAHQPGVVRTKAEILDGVWSYDFDGDPNIVEVYIGRLRRKIDEPFSTPLITTVRGVGYRLEDGT